MLSPESSSKSCDDSEHVKSSHRHASKEHNGKHKKSKGKSHKKKASDPKKSKGEKHFAEASFFSGSSVSSDASDQYSSSVPNEIYKRNPNRSPMLRMTIPPPLDSPRPKSTSSERSSVSEADQVLQPTPKNSPHGTTPIPPPSSPAPPENPVMAIAPPPLQPPPAIVTPAEKEPVLGTIVSRNLDALQFDHKEAKKLKSANKALHDISLLVSLIDVKGASAENKEVVEKIASLSKHALPQEIVPFPGIITHMVCSGSKVWVASLSSDKSASSLSLVDTETYQTINILPPPSRITSMAIAGRYVWVGTESGCIFLYLIDTPECAPEVLRGHAACAVVALEPNQYVVAQQNSAPPSATVNRSAFMKNGTMVSVGAKNEIICWDIVSRKQVKFIECSSPCVQACSTSIGKLWLVSEDKISEFSLLDGFKFTEVCSLASAAAGINASPLLIPLLPPAIKESRTAAVLQNQQPQIPPPMSLTPHAEQSSASHCNDVLPPHDSATPVNVERKLSAQAIECPPPHEKDVSYLFSRSIVCTFGEVWIATSKFIYCWDKNTQQLVARIKCSEVTTMIGVGPFVCTFSRAGIIKWDARTHSVVSVFTSEPCNTGMFVFEGSSMYIWAGIYAGPIVHFKTSYIMHNFVETKFVSPVFCQICRRTLWAGNRTGYQCNNCKHYCVHAGCLHCVQTTLPCDGIGLISHPPPKKDSPGSLAAMVTKGGAKRLTPRDVAQAVFLVRFGVNPVEVGDWLGTGGNEEVIKEWVELLDLKDLDFEQALRRYLRSFSLPGESQKIDRLMQGFAGRYYELSRELFEPPLFRHSDGCYVLAFSCIMLNTALHNPESGIHFTVEQWVESNEGLNCKSGEEEEGNPEKNFDKEFLIHLYNQIRDAPFQFFSMEPSPMMQGYLAREKKQVFCQILGDKFVISKKRSSTSNEAYELSQLTISESSNTTGIVITRPGANETLFTAPLSFTVRVWLHAFEAAQKRIKNGETEQK